MINREVIKNWTQAHFLAYLYISMADSDFNISEEELESIQKKLKKVFEKKLNLEESAPNVIKEVKKELSGHDSEDRKEVLRSNQDKLKFDEGIKNDILSDLNDIISTDLVVDFNEHHMLGYARKILEQQA